MRLTICQGCCHGCCHGGVLKTCCPGNMNFSQRPGRRLVIYLWKRLAKTTRRKFRSYYAPNKPASPMNVRNARCFSIWCASLESRRQCAEIDSGVAICRLACPDTLVAAGQCIFRTLAERIRFVAMSIQPQGFTCRWQFEWRHTAFELRAKRWSHHG
jgi:hypothetical protein